MTGAQGAILTALSLAMPLLLMAGIASINRTMKGNL